MQHPVVIQEVGRDEFLASIEDVHHNLSEGYELEIDYQPILTTHGKGIKHCAVIMIRKEFDFEALFASLVEAINAGSESITEAILETIPGPPN